VVFKNIDYDAKANFVIERVFERGDVPDIRIALNIMAWRK
jgi:hypothetical protein